MVTLCRPLPDAPPVDSSWRSVDDLASSLCAGAANLTAYEYRWLRDLAEFDQRRGWLHWEQPSCAAWLSWQVGLEARSAREKVRVARALTQLPLVSAAMASGHLCYSKVRAITRVATPATEAALVDLARSSTTAQFERIAAATRRAVEDAEVDSRRVRAGRRLTHRVEADNSVCITLRLPGDDAAAFLAAVEAFVGDPVTGDPVESTAARRADAAVAMAVAACAEEPTLAPQPVMTVLVDCRSFTSDGGRGAVHVNRPDAADVVGPACSAGVDGAMGDVPVAPAVVLRQCCDARVQTVVHHADGRLDVSERHGLVRGGLRRAVLARDRHCQFPGCRRHSGVEIHHLVHRAHGGTNDPDNLAVLCRFHHHRLHDERWTLRRTSSGLVVSAPDGRVFADPEAVTGDQRAVLDLGLAADDGRCRWQGDPLDLVEALGFLANPDPVAERAARRRARSLGSAAPRASAAA